MGVVTYGTYAHQAANQCSKRMSKKAMERATTAIHLHPKIGKYTATTVNEAAVYTSVSSWENQQVHLWFVCTIICGFSVHCCTEFIY